MPARSAALPVLMRRHRLPLYPTARQVEALEAWHRLLVGVWNAALEQRQTLYRGWEAVPAGDEQDRAWTIRRQARHPPRPHGPRTKSGRPRLAASAHALNITARSAAQQPGVRPTGRRKGEPVSFAGPASARDERLLVNQTRQLQDAAAAGLLDTPEAVPALPAKIRNQVLVQLDQAYEHAYRRLRAGENAGFPQFHSAVRRRPSIALPSIDQTHAVVHPDGQRTCWIRIERLGWVKGRSDLPLADLGADRLLGAGTVYRDRAGRWWCSLTIRAEDPYGNRGPREPGTQQGLRVVGVDRGVRKLAAASDGRRWYPPAELAPLLAQRVALQRTMARQWRTNNAGRLAADNRLLPGRTAVRSHRWEITRRKLAALDDRIVRLRDQHLHQIANDLAATADVIVIENLNIKNMTHTARGTLTDPGRNVRAKAALNRSILNSGWGRLHRMLADRAEVYGIELVAIPARDTSRTCAEPECGHCEEDNRHGESFTCLACGHADDADVNAARVIRMRGLTRERSSNKRNPRERSRLGAGTPTP